jgi:hypothetical protein
MNSKHFWALLLGASIIAASASAQQASEHTASSSGTAAGGNKTLTAVTRSTAAGDSTRNSDAQPLRFETSWGSADIIRGADGPIVGTVGWFRDFDVEKLVESSPRAVAEARNFESQNSRGSIASAIGATMVGIGILVAGNNGHNASTPIIIFAGAGAIGWGLQQINTGYAALSKALWWYNHDQLR